MNYSKKTEKIRAILLAAGKSTRTAPLTDTRPKPLLKILDKTILEILIEELYYIQNLVEIVVVIGYKKEMMIKEIERLKPIFSRIKIVYVEQGELLGTGSAVMSAYEAIKENGSFNDIKKNIVMGCDDLFSKKDLIKLTNNENSMLVDYHNSPERFGVIITDNDVFNKTKQNEDVKTVAKLKEIIEKPTESISNLVNVGAYMLDNEIFNILPSIKKSVRGEIEFTDAVTAFSKKNDIFIEKIENYWFPISYPWNYLEANAFMLKKLEEANGRKSVIRGTVENNVVIKGFVYIEEDAKVKGGSYLEGPIFIGKGTEIGPFAHIRPDSVFGELCRIGKMEVFDSVIMDKTVGKHFGYIGHSVIGANVNIGAGLITADYRHDGKNNVTIAKNQKVDSGRRKLGTFIGDNVNTGIGTLIYPGRMIKAGDSTLPGEIVKANKM